MAQANGLSALSTDDSSDSDSFIVDSQTSDDDDIQSNSTSKGHRNRHSLSLSNLKTKFYHTFCLLKYRFLLLAFHDDSNSWSYVGSDDICDSVENYPALKPSQLLLFAAIKETLKSPLQPLEFLDTKSKGSTQERSLLKTAKTFLKQSTVPIILMFLPDPESASSSTLVRTCLSPHQMLRELDLSKIKESLFSLTSTTTTSSWFYKLTQQQPSYRLLNPSRAGTKHSTTIATSSHQRSSEMLIPLTQKQRLYRDCLAQSPTNLVFKLNSHRFLMPHFDQNQLRLLDIKQHFFAEVLRECDGDKITCFCSQYRRDQCVHTPLLSHSGETCTGILSSVQFIPYESADCCFFYLSSDYGALSHEINDTSCLSTHGYVVKIDSSGQYSCSCKVRKCSHGLDLHEALQKPSSPISDDIIHKLLERNNGFSAFYNSASHDIVAAPIGKTSVDNPVQPAKEPQPLKWVFPYSSLHESRIKKSISSAAFSASLNDLNANLPDLRCPQCSNLLSCIYSELKVILPDGLSRCSFPNYRCNGSCQYRLDFNCRSLGLVRYGNSTVCFSESYLFIYFLKNQHSNCSFYAESKIYKDFVTRLHLCDDGTDTYDPNTFNKAYFYWIAGVQFNFHSQDVNVKDIPFAGSLFASDQDFEESFVPISPLPAPASSDVEEKTQTAAFKCCCPHCTADGFVKTLLVDATNIWIKKDKLGSSIPITTPYEKSDSLPNLTECIPRPDNSTCFIFTSADPKTSKRKPITKQDLQSLSSLFHASVSAYTEEEQQWVHSVCDLSFHPLLELFFSDPSTSWSKAFKNFIRLCSDSHNHSSCRSVMPYAAARSLTLSQQPDARTQLKQIKTNPLPKTLTLLINNTLHLSSSSHQQPKEQKEQESSKKKRKLDRVSFDQKLLNMLLFLAKLTMKIHQHPPISPFYTSQLDDQQTKDLASLLGPSSVTGISYYIDPRCRKIRPRFFMDNDPAKEKADCTKKFGSARNKTGGIFCCFCSHGYMLGWHVVANAESRNDPYSFIVTFLPKAPQVVIYDFACALETFCMNRDPEFFKNTLFLIDRFHQSNHRCSEAYRLSQWMHLDQIGSTLPERSNSFFSKLKIQLSYMNLEHFSLFIDVHAQFLNFTLSEREHSQSPSKDQQQSNSK